jgi:SPP1 family predicted phage head-tail adaptor
MRLRSRKHRVTIMSRSASTGAGSRGQRTSVWLPVGAARASIKQLKGDELQHAREISEEAEYEMEMHYTSLVTPQSRIGLGKRIFNVHSVDNVEMRNRDLVLLCSEEVSST